jgi:hypothetical protein
LWAGLLCGVLDITAAFVVYGLLYRVKPGRILQGIASGLLGSNAFAGGVATALLGLVCHFIIAFGAAAVYLIASRGIPFLIQHAVISGAFYGVAVYFFMNLVVVPLSAAAPRPLSLKAMLIGIVIHVFCVGLAISLTIRRFAASA